MTEVNNEIKPSFLYDWNKAAKTGQRDEIIARVRDEFIATLLADTSLNKSIFIEKFDRTSVRFPYYVNPVPTVIGGPPLVKLLTVDCKDVTGGVLRAETNAEEAVKPMLDHIESNRKKLGI